VNNFLDMGGDGVTGNVELGWIGSEWNDAGWVKAGRRVYFSGKFLGIELRLEWQVTVLNIIIYLLLIRY
jgi:hypothetical protein